MKKTSIFLAVLALRATVSAQTAPVYKFKKPIAQLPVQASGGGGSNPPPVLVGELDVSTNSLNFSSVEVGNSQNLSFLVGNFGQASLTLNPVTYLGAGFSANSVCGSSLAVGEDCQVSITFTPTQRGPFNGSATVTSSVGSETVTFTGQGIQASGAIQALTSSDFGAVEVGQSADRSFVYSNTGDAPSRNTYVSTVSAPLSLVSNGCGTVVAPVTLNPGQNCTVSLRYQPTSSSPLSANLTIVSSAENSPVSLSLTGGGEQALASFTPVTTSAYGLVEVGQFADRTFTFSNTGIVPARNVYALALSAPLSYVSNTCGTVAAPIDLNPGQNCSVTVRYSPTSTAALSSNVVVQSSASNSPSTLSITGQGAQALGALQAASSSNFGNVVVGQSADRTFTFTNNGDAPARNTYLSAVSAPLSIVSNTCGTFGSPVTVNQGENCSVTLRYQPTSTAALSTSISVASSASNSPSSLTVSGQGTQAQALLAGLGEAPDFGQVFVGQNSEISFMFNNTGTAAASNVYATVAGSSAVTIVNNECGTAAVPGSLPPGGECMVTLRYAPTSAGTLTGTSLSVFSSAPNSPSTSTLTGTAVTNDPLAGVTASTSYDFGVVSTGSSSSRTFNIRNNGGGVLTNITFSLSSSANITTSSNTCAGASLASSQSCQITYTWAPTAQGPISRTVSVNTSQNSLSFSLTGATTPRCENATDMASVAYGGTCITPQGITGINLGLNANWTGRLIMKSTAEADQNWQSATNACAAVAGTWRLPTLQEADFLRGSPRTTYNLNTSWTANEIFEPSVQSFASATYISSAGTLLTAPKTNSARVRCYKTY